MAEVTATFVVEGMHCANCGLLVDEVLEDLPGVTSSSTDTRHNTTVVIYDPDVVAPADPDDRGQQMKPVVDDRDERIEIGDDTLGRIHLSVAQF